MPPENYDISTHGLKVRCSASELRGREAPLQTKLCGTCRQSKPLTDFNRKASRPDGRQEVCRECNRESSRRYYARNREHHVGVIVANSQAARRADDLRVLDFDHRPGTGKRKDVMAMVKDGFGLARLLEEIQKCDVRCRNCHAIVTLERGGDNWRSRAMREALDD